MLGNPDSAPTNPQSPISQRPIGRQEEVQWVTPRYPPGAEDPKATAALEAATRRRGTPRHLQHLPAHPIITSKSSTDKEGATCQSVQ